MISDYLDYEPPNHDYVPKSIVLWKNVDDFMKNETSFYGNTLYFFDKYVYFV